ncbi:MerR family DNA-binding protein, partial [Vibrio parahaemolyticus]|uniref:MerR family DNA-binding protein n=1 Tax=Vibrio parahaemolyticus TaxID=670 RepID=UPI002114539A
AKELGLIFDEIKDILEIKLEATENSCAEVKDITSAKLELIDEKINELTKILRALKKINDACCGHTNDDDSHCSILSSIE